MRSRRRLVAVAALCTAVLLAGCAGPAAPEDPPPRAAATSAPAQEATSPAPTAAPTTTQARPPAARGRLVELRTIGGDIAPKSVTATGTGLVFAQNMMYRHTVTVYDRSFDLVATSSDEVVPSEFGIALDGAYRGAPVEAAVTPDGKHVYVSNYSMYGPGFREGSDSAPRRTSTRTASCTG